MAPALLDCNVEFVDGPTDAAGGLRCGGAGRASAAILGGGGGPGASRRVASSEKIAAYLEAMVPRLTIVDPPKQCSLEMVRPVQFPWQSGQRLDSGTIASVDNNLFALYAGPYRPTSRSIGCYLVYDADRAHCSLSTIPAVPCSYSCTSIGCGTIIVRRRRRSAGWSFVLAELLTDYNSSPAKAVLFLWSQHRFEGSWVQAVGRLPAEVCPPTYLFTSYIAFPFRAPGGGSYLCWVDLLYGMLLCDLATAASSPDFRFVPLPPGHAIDTTRDSSYQLRPHEFRNMACVAGAIKFLNMDGLTLTSWTLAPDFSGWTEDTSLSVGDLWADESFLSRGLPQLRPTCPVLGVQQDVVYLHLLDAEDFDECKPNHVLSVDMRRHKVLSSVEQDIEGASIWPEVIATDIWNAGAMSPAAVEEAAEAWAELQKQGGSTGGGIHGNIGSKDSTICT
ncbi:hypothetical protein ACP4OV_001632 [Aristida adscensionis]